MKARNHPRLAPALPHSEGIAYKPLRGEIAMCSRVGRMGSPNISRCMLGAGLSRRMRGEVLPYCQRSAVRNDREGRGNVGMIRSPNRASTLPD